MMQAMRENMKVIIWITAIVFLVGFGILQLGGVLEAPQSQGPTGVIAKINGEPIRYEDFMRTYTTMMDQLRQEREIRTGEDSYVREQAWQQLVQAKLMDQEVRRRGIKVTPEEIKIALRYSPPELVTRAPIFMTNGTFDYQKYVAELDNPNSQMPWSQLEAYVAQTLPQQKLQDDLVQGAKVSGAEVRARFLNNNEKLRVRYLLFPVDSFEVDTSRIGGADIETYYKAHPDEFTGPAEVNLQVAVIPRRPKDPDFAVVRERMQGILDQLTALPDSFPSFARTYSEITSAQRGGKVEEADYQTMRPAIQAGLKSVPPGQLSPIIREERSLHLFRVDRRWMDPASHREKLAYHEIVLRVEPGAETIRETRKTIEETLAEARREGLSKVATRRGLATRTTNYFREGTSGNDMFRRFPEVEAWAFRAKVGSVSRAVPSEYGWYLYQILDRQAAGLKSLGAARLTVRERLVRSLQVAKATQAAEEARAAVLAGTSEADAAKRFHAMSGTAPEVMRSGMFAPIGLEAKVVGTLFSTPVGSWSGALAGNVGTYVCFIEAHIRPSEEDFQKQEAQYRNGLIEERRQARFSEWLQEIRRRAKVEDYRENFFEA